MWSLTFTGTSADLLIKSFKTSFVKFHFRYKILFQKDAFENVSRIIRKTAIYSQASVCQKECQLEWSVLTFCVMSVITIRAVLLNNRRAEVDA